jgi:hypothetical protein
MKYKVIQVKRLVINHIQNIVSISNNGAKLNKNS